MIGDEVKDFFKEGQELAKKEEELQKEWEEYANQKETYSGLFDFLKFLFNTTDMGQTKWEDLSVADKKRNSFMTNRMMAIQYPTTANALNELKSDGVSVVESWRYALLCSGYKGTRMPSWIYTKSGKSEKDNPFAKIKKETLVTYCRNHECGMRELYEMYRNFPQDVMLELDYLEGKDIYNTKGKKAKS